MRHESRIDAHLAIVSHVPYVERDGDCWINPVESRMLQIFGNHFAQVTLVRPRANAGADHEEWVKLPQSWRARELRRPGDRLDRLLMQPGIPPRRLPQLIQDADVIYGRLPGYEAYFALRLGRRWGRATVASLHGDWPEAYQAEWVTGLRRLLAPLAIKRADRIFRWVGREVDVLATVGEGLRSRYGAAREDACVFANYLVSAEDLVERADACGHDPTRLLFVGVLSPRKGVAFLIDALRQLRDSGRDVSLTVVGEGDQRRRLVEQVRRLRLEHFVTFVGYVNMGPELWSYYENHDAFVLPSVGAEGSPKVVVEALAKSCPVIATRVGSVPLMIQDGVTGILVEPGRSADIAKAVTRVCEDAKLRRKMVRAGLQYAADNTYQQQAERVGNALRRALIPKFGERVAKPG